MAGGASMGGEDEGITGINVTPFVDIALVLLIIFMVTAKYITSQSIPVDLPEARTANDTQQSATASVSVDRTGQIFVDAQAVTPAALRDAMRARVRENPELRAIINADRATPHGRVTEVIDLVREGGVTRFAIQTTQPAPAESPQS